MKITVIAVGKTSTPEISRLIDGYLRRIGHYIGFELVELPDARGCRDSESQKRAEGDAILKRLTAADTVVLLDERGREMTSVEFARFLEGRMNAGIKRLVFIIGGHYGFSQVVYARADRLLGLSQMTFTHEMVRLFFTEQVYYPDAVANSIFLDITDIVTENMSSSQGENATIESKLSAEQQSLYKIGNKYYGLPHYAAYFGIVYDIDLFDQHNLYFNYDRTGLIVNKTEKKSVGLDGIEGTDDDGLPMTYDEMFTLCNAMRNRGITPFIWTGKSREGYTGALINALYADYEGLEDFMLNFNLQGTAHNLVDSVVSDADGKITSIKTHTEELDSATGYKVYQQAGRAYALSFMEQIVSGDFYAEECKDESFANTEAQRAFLESRPYGSKPIAMLIDGKFWDEVASNDFYEIENVYLGEEWKRENRRCGFMPYPKATEEKEQDGLTLFAYL